jgi:hypothetical protein
MLERTEMLGGEAPPPFLIASWVTSGDPAHTASVLDSVVAFVEAAPAAFSTSTVRRQHVATADGFDVRTRRWDERAYRTAVDALTEPESLLILTWDDEVSLDVNRDEPSGRWRWLLVALPDDDALDAAAEAWSSLLPLLAEHGSVDWAGIYHDQIPATPATPHEEYLGIEGGAETAAQHPRHYCWSNLLTAEHVAGLGGPAQLTRRAAAEGLRALPVSGSAVVVDTGNPLSRFDDDRLAAVKRLLDPVLRHEPYIWYAGLPLRVVKEPGTAYRRIPPEIAEPWFEDDPAMPSDGGTARQLVPDD